MIEINEKEIENIIGYKFKNCQLLSQVFIHTSFHQNIEFDRLEFLGDRVLSFIVASFLYNKFPGEETGKLALRYVGVTNTSILAQSGSFLEPYIKCTGKSSASVIADTMEALIGSIFIDGGYLQAKKFINRFIIKNCSLEGEKNSKNSLQEWAQKNSFPIPEYICTYEKDHFIAIVKIKGFQVFGIGHGSSKKFASIAAANDLWQKIQDN